VPSLALVLAEALQFLARAALAPREEDQVAAADEVAGVRVLLVRAERDLVRPDRVEVRLARRSAALGRHRRAVGLAALGAKVDAALGELGAVLCQLSERHVDQGEHDGRAKVGETA
jgi:hypothetical protein